MKKVNSHSDFLSESSEDTRSYLLLYKEGSAESVCAFRNFENAITGNKDAGIYAADVTQVKDIHTNYGITTVPALLVFENCRLSGVIKGCQESDYYKAMTEHTLYQAKTATEDKPGRRVTVYSTPSCSWCNTLKAWLLKNKIAYTDVDISRDQRAADDLVRRSGQQGVPQTDINGQIIVGFNQQRLKELLGI